MTGNKKISNKDVAKLLSEWNQEFKLFVPSRETGISVMARWNGKDTSFLDWYRNTVVSPKVNFLPPMEEMFHFQKDKDGYHLEPPSSDGQKQLIFGIRPCDAEALAILDMTFEDTYQDPYYLPKRKNAILVGLGCTNPYDSCFCTSLEGNPTDSTNVDLMLTDIGDDFLIEAITEAGKELLTKTSSLKEATKSDETRAKARKEAAYQKITRQLDTKNIKDKLLASFDEEDYWQNTAAKCISCGVCTFLCPTCYCFDISDEVLKGEGSRFRCLDTCSFPTYTKMPMENPRTEKWRRVRNKVCHKYEFYPMNFDVIACTGCGRCIRLCPVNWDIIQTLNNLPAKV
ncbi:4Fe-4S dicluster domain-containing protein [Chloroflexota bacterium]